MQAEEGVPKRGVTQYTVDAAVGLQWGATEGTATTKRRANGSTTVKRRDEYHRSHKDAAVGATRGATKRGTTSRMQQQQSDLVGFGQIPRRQWEAGTSRRSL